MSTAFETIDRAAHLMRERAEATTAGPWSAEAIGSEGFHVFASDGSRAPLKGRARVAACTWQDWEEAEPAAEHIASWHPAVALEVANWLDTVLAAMCPPGSEATILGRSISPVDEAAALAVARAYLGEES